jgi:hypothetical protein
MIRQSRSNVKPFLTGKLPRVGISDSRTFESGPWCRYDAEKNQTGARRGIGTGPSVMSRTTYIAFRSSQRLHETTDGFISRMAGGARTPEPKTVEAIMTDFLDEALQAFFIEPQDFLRMSSSMKRIVNMAVDTISGASRLIVKRTAKKLDIRQNREAAEYMDSMREKKTDTDGRDIWYVTFPISDAMRDRGLAAIKQAREGSPSAALEPMTAFLLELTDVGLEWYFEKPMKLMGFGPVVSKMVNVGVETTRKAAKGVVRKVFAKLEDDQVRAAADYIESLMLEV